MSLTRRELVRAAIAHEETGRIPYAFDFTPEAAARLQEHLGCEDLAGEIGNCIREVPPVWWRFANEPEDQKEPGAPSRLPDVIGVGSFDTMAETVTRLRETSDAFLLVRCYASLFEKAWFVRGMENLLADMVLHPDYCEALFERIVTADLNMLEMMLAADVDGVLLGCDWGSQQALLMSPPLWRRYVGSRHARMFERIRGAGKYAFLHSCGNIVAVLPDVVAMGVQVVNPAQPECMDLRQLKAEFGGALTFWGGISTQQTLPRGTPAEVRAETREVAALLGRGGGYILSPAQALQEDVPLENVLAIVEEARRISEGG
ncbi:MAG TPA: uroporphyrinogen decarboxylase family protein [Armatimonadota bacterium]|jgi:uroporphyrinogen decarboxylase